MTQSSPFLSSPGKPVAPTQLLSLICSGVKVRNEDSFSPALPVWTLVCQGQKCPRGKAIPKAYSPYSG